MISISYCCRFIPWCCQQHYLCHDGKTQPCMFCLHISGKCFIFLFLFNTQKGIAVLEYKVSLLMICCVCMIQGSLFSKISRVVLVFRNISSCFCRIKPPRNFRLCYCYCLQTKLWKDNVFTGVHLFKGKGQVQHMHHEMGDLPPPQTSGLESTPSVSLLLTSCGCNWWPGQMYPLENLPHLYWHLVVANETCIVGKWVVRILRECRVVVCYFVVVFHIKSLPIDVLYNIEKYSHRGH